MCSSRIHGPEIIASINCDFFIASISYTSRLLQWLRFLCFFFLIGSLLRFNLWISSSVFYGFCIILHPLKTNASTNCEIFIASLTYTFCFLQRLRFLCFSPVLYFVSTSESLSSVVRVSRVFVSGFDAIYEIHRELTEVTTPLWFFWG